jgi:hypothetical protein
MISGSSMAASVPPLAITTASAATTESRGACTVTSTPYIERNLGAGPTSRATRSRIGRVRVTRLRMWRLASTSSSLKPANATTATVTGGVMGPR